MTEFISLTNSVILCEKCERRLHSIGGESNPNGGYTEHFHCKDCNVNIDIVIKFGAILTMADDEPTSRVRIS